VTVSKRPATVDDEPFLRSLFCKVRAAEFLGIPEAQRSPLLNMQFDAQRTHYTAAFPGAETSVIECDGQPVGNLILACMPAAIRVVDVNILPAWQGKGIGSRILAEVLSSADEEGRPTLLQVFATNRARRLYARLGFEEEGAEGPYLSMKRMPGGRSV
jgi:GNAT superfamily N-acetyltransferase